MLTLAATTNYISINIGGLNLVLDLKDAGLNLATYGFSAFTPFLADPSEVSTQDFKLTLKFSSCLQEFLETEIDPVGQSWHYERSGNYQKLLFRPALKIGGWTHSLVLNLDRNEGVLSFSNPYNRKTAVYSDLFPAFLDKFIFTAMLNHLGGCLIHSAALADYGKGILLAGDSGKGKSTSGQIWRDHGGLGTTCLTDECSMVRELKPGEFWIFGTPWPSSAGIAHPTGTRLSRIYFLEHGLENTVEKVNPQAALFKLLEQGRFSFWDQEGVAVGLDTIINLSQTVPAYILRFRPDPAVIGFVRNHLSTQAV